MSIGAFAAGSEIQGRPGSQSPVLFLDQIRQPYGPCPAAREASQAAREFSLSFLETQLRHRLGEVYHLSPAAISLFTSTDTALAQIVESTRGPLVGFPPSALVEGILRKAPEREGAPLARGPGRTDSLTLDMATDLPPNGVAMIASPADPLGSLLATADAVRLARACRYVVVDEKYAEVAGFSLLHLSVEFDNVAVVRSFEYWAGIDDPPCAWVAASPRMLQALGLDGFLPRQEALAEASASLASLDSINATLRLLREERSRLFRFLRRFSFLEPMPSWGPFLSARVNLVPRSRLVAGLVRRGVHIHAPESAGLERVVRIGIGTRSEMDRLRGALLDVGRELLS